MTLALFMNRRGSVTGKHVYLTDIGAKEVMELALKQHEGHIAQQARTKAFADCTKMWQQEIEKIIDEEGLKTVQLTRILELFGVKYAYNKETKNEYG